MSFPAGAPAPTSVSGFRHEAFLYRTRAECVAGVQAFLDEAGRREQPALVVAPAATLSGLDGGRGVHCEDAAQLARNPARLIPAVGNFLEEQAGAGAPGARIVIEPLWPGRSRSEVDEVVRHEALANLAFEGRQVSMLCAYDASVVGAGLAGHLARTHPEVVERGGSRHSSSFGELPAVVDPDAWPLDPPPPDAAAIEVRRGGLPGVRHFIRQQARVAGLSREREAELVLAVNEVVTNSLVHGLGGGVLRSWTGPRDLICEVADGGRIEDPLAGRRPPTEDSEGRRGLWMVNQLCDLVQLRSGAGGTKVRMHMARRGNRTPSPGSGSGVGAGAN